MIEPRRRFAIREPEHAVFRPEDSAMQSARRRHPRQAGELQPLLTA